MKYKNRLLIILTFLISASCSNRHDIIITGNAKDGRNEMLWLERLQVNITVPVDSQKINKKDNFRFNFNAQHPDIYILKNKNGKFISLLLHPGDKINISTGYNTPEKDYSISGSPDSEKIKSLVNKLDETKEQLRALDNSYAQHSTTTELQTTEYLENRKNILKSQRNFSISFIMENLTSLASIYALYQTYAPNQLVLGENRDLQYMKIVADTLSVKYPQVPLVNTFVSDARNAEKRYYNLIGLSGLMKEAGTGLPDLAIESIKGDIIKLSSLKGKTVLLYFWSSLSQTCRNLHPALVKTYKNYKNKGFEIYAVSLDNDRQVWERAIWVDELEWINVSELSFPDSKAAMTYNVTKLPTNYLINREGDIIARDLYGYDLERWLDNTLK